MSDSPTVHYDSPSEIAGHEVIRPYLGDLGIARGREPDVRTDVLSLGLSLYRCLSGRTVYDAIDDVDTNIEARSWLIHRITPP